MEFNAAIVQNGNSTFVVVIVRREVLNDSYSISQARNVFRKYFPLYPIVLMGQDARGDGIYDGQEDIVKFLAKIKPEQLPWKSYTVK